jgi:hypothetical protein
MFHVTKIYRMLFCRKGYGVHSPFVFDLITNVIEEMMIFYAYHDIAQIRLQLLQKDKPIHYRDKKLAVKKVLRQYGISKKEGEFLFRMANHYKPHSILSVGSSMGLAPLCLSRYNSTVQCVTLEEEQDLAEIATHFLNKEKNPSLLIKTGAYEVTIPESIVQLQQIDCIFFGKDVEANNIITIFQQYLPFIHDNTFCVLAGIRSSSEKQHCWKQCCQLPCVTVAVDLFDMGILFFQPKLHKRTYKTILP